MTTTLSPDVDHDTAPRRRFSIRVALGLTVAVLMVAFWVYAFVFAPDRKADELHDKSFVTAANARCQASFAELNALPRANTAETPEQRGAVVDQSNSVLTTMVDGLRSDAADATGRDRELLDLWFADWDAYIGDRAQYADVLRAGEPTVFTVQARDGGQITETMDGFARANRITSCLVPLDV